MNIITKIAIKKVEFKRVNGRDPRFIYLGHKQWREVDEALLVGLFPRPRMTGCEVLLVDREDHLEVS